ncbi:hypothetical protein DL765_005399 [Monosporascus sp. GIB2]|nr:hypothetical protein DL765_005399 [Monosporascus sp. GIB2]
MAPALPATVGQRLLPSLVNEIALTDPGRVLYSVAKTGNLTDGFQDISATAFARAVDCYAWYLDKNMGPGRDFPTLTYMGPQDVVYAILILACVKTGCNTFLLPPNFALPVIKQILAARQMRVLEIPGMQHWMEDELVEPYPYPKPGRADDIIVFSTGEKLNSLEMESIINANSAVNAALVAGTGRFQSCLLVEAIKPPTNDAEKEKLLEAI